MSEFNLVEYIKKIYIDNEIDILEVNIKSKDNRNLIQVIIEKKDINEKISIEDCVKVSKFLSPKLDEIENKISYKNYNLEVSSPGIYRKLHNLNDFIKFKTKKVEVSFLNEENKKSKIEGKINDVIDNDIIIITKSNMPFRINIDKIKKANLI